MENKKESHKQLEEGVTYIPDNPETPFEMINKYGTYEIQPTAETADSFPTIAQGLPKKRNKPSVKPGYQRNNSSL